MSKKFDAIHHGGHERDVIEIEALLRELDIGDLDQLMPPPSVWAGVEAQVEAQITDAARVAPVVAIESRRRPWWQLTSIAAAVVLVVGGGAIWFTNRGDPGVVLSTAVLAHDPVMFDPLGADSVATAELVERDGRLEIDLVDANLPNADDDDLELWLIQVDADGNPIDIASVSMVDADHPGSYQIPDGLDPTTHPIVDISIEPHDGDADHSGRSILRGVLESA
jgi:anti-sigma-K factor RskA